VAPTQFRLAITIDSLPGKEFVLDAVSADVSVAELIRQVLSWLGLPSDEGWCLAYQGSPLRFEEPLGSCLPCVDQRIELVLVRQTAASQERKNTSDVFASGDCILERESGSQVPELDTDSDDSDFDLALGDSEVTVGEDNGSQVVALHEEEADEAAATIAAKRRPAASDLEGAAQLAAGEPEDIVADLDELAEVLESGVDLGAPAKRKMLETDDEVFGQRAAGEREDTTSVEGIAA
jgi:hypothetical protein